MTTLWKAVHEYLALRRSLGFKLQKAGKALPAFVTFMEQQRASVITSQLALTWAQQPTTVQPAEWAYRLSMVRGFAPSSQGDRSAHRNSTRRVTALSSEASATLSLLRRGDPTLTPCGARAARQP